MRPSNRKIRKYIDKFVSRNERQKLKEGFTIIEVMIVLAITGVLLLSAIIAISGRQNKTEFTVAIQQAKSNMQTAINDVTSGFYPNNSPFSCSYPQALLNTGSGGAPTITNTSTPQGQNDQETYTDNNDYSSGCVFVGEAMQFAVADSGGNLISPQEVNQYVVVGSKNVSSCTGGGCTQYQPDTYKQAQIYALSTAGAVPSSTIPIDSSSTYLENGLTVYKMFYCANSSPTVACETNNKTYAFAMLNSFSPQLSQNPLNNGASGGIASGRQTLNVVPVVTVPVQSQPWQAVNIVNNGGAAATPSLPLSGLASYADEYLSSSASTQPGAQNIFICLASGTTNQSGLIMLSQGGGEIESTLQIYSNNTCGM